MEIVRKICYDNNIGCIERLYRYIGMLCADEELLNKLSEGDELLMEVKEEVELFNNKGRFLISPEEEERIWENTIIHDAEKRGILKTAKKMILNGFDNAMISKITGLRIDEIDKLCK
ncbi:MAG: hypothetical protein IJB83_00190 [Bacilli bacterium]|nr:hypothetical protein [Bacilli bacterium]